ncbi:MAG: glucosyltransferase-I precursor [Deltaproteobacteria bacterium]|nr:glucosyltransferase-I precursor [Deltaproteobacteria bacterium]
MRRIVIILVAALGCGQPQPAGTDGAVDGDGNLIVDAAVDGDGNLLVDAAVDAPIDGPPVTLCPAGQWCVETAPIPAGTRLSAVHAIDATDVFAVGDAGTIIRRRSNAWSTMQSGTTQNLKGVWASSSDDVWAVGQNGTVLHFNGMDWSAVPGVDNIDYTGVSGSAANAVWLVGTSTVQRWNGIAWTKNAIAGTLLGISGTGATDIWVCSEAAYLKHSTGAGFSTVMPGGGTDFYAVKAIGATDVWASTPGTGTVHFTGSGWTQHATANAVFVSLHAIAANDVWGVSQSKTGHWNGSTWSITTPAGLTMSLWGISGAGAHVWTVGSGATILHRN